jgi:recombinational DNA repair protein RecT
MNSVIEASMIGLEIGGPLGQCALVPFYNNQTKQNEAQLIVEYKGLMCLGYRSGQIANFSGHPVFEKDDFHYSYGIQQNLTHRPYDDGDPGALKYAYAVVNYRHGGYDFEVVNHRIAMEAKSRSPAKNSNSSPWNNSMDEPAMWVKTAIRRLAKRIPQSPELQQAVALESSLENGQAQNFQHVIDIDLPNANLTDEPDNGNGQDEQQEAIDVQTQEQAPAPQEKQGIHIPDNLPPAGPEGQTVTGNVAPSIKPTEVSEKDAKIITSYKLTSEGFPEETAQACKHLGFTEDITPYEAEQIIAKVNEIIDTQ